VRILQENRDVGSTNAAGRLLVPDMRAFEVNHLAIDPTDIPLDATVDKTTRDVRPQDRSGVVVKFAVRVSHGALLRLVDEAGHPVPVGSTARLRTAGESVPIGFDGEAYLLNLTPWNQVDVEEPDGLHCVAAFNYLPVKGLIPTVGPLVCQVRPL